MQVRKPFKRALGIAAIALVVLAWGGAAAAYFLMKPTVVQWTAIVTAAAVATEIAFWIGATLLGISALQRFRLFKGGAARSAPQA